MITRCSQRSLQILRLVNKNSFILSLISLTFERNEDDKTQYEDQKDTNTVVDLDMDSASPVELQVPVQFASCSATVQSPRANGCPGLSPSVWKKLPDELLEIVFTKLPISALKKFLQLSKRWRVFIYSEDFARRCQSKQLTAVYFDRHASRSWLYMYTAIPSRKTESWMEHFLKFIPQESIDKLVAADQGLLCYQLRKEYRMGQSFQFEEIVLVVHNPFTRKWRRLVVPYNPETETRRKAVMYEDNMLVGLCVDEETGRYKLVVAFLDKDLTGKTFVYNSASASWTISSAVFPGLGQRGEFSEWAIQRSICCGGEVFWLVEELTSFSLDDYPHFMTLIKYSMMLDTWSLATQQRPCEEGCELHLSSFEHRLMLVNFGNVSETNILFPDEFSSLVPGVVKFDVQAFREVMNKAVYVHDDDEYYFGGSTLPRKAAAEGSALFIHSEFYDMPSLEVIFGFDGGSPKVIRLPPLTYLDRCMVPFLFTYRLKAFV
ncbi:hypothetical protein R1sor_021173 [Riccia sorocarpa]|uniref:F-box domain-containing protein n=1 Tax=Riccia sorocarpa TaxID=122646 RepID=A0ABD3GJ73_9MARC